MTIQRRLWIFNLILIIITIVLLIGVSLIITKNFQDFIGLPARDDQIEPLNRTLLRADRTVNKTIETAPDQFLNPEYLHQIDDFLNSSSTGLIVKRGDEVLYYSPFLESLEAAKEKILSEQHKHDQNPGRIIRLSDTLFMKIIPFQFTDQSSGTLFLVNDATSVSRELKQFKSSVINTLILFLIIIISINTLMTYFLSLTSRL